MKLFTGIIVIVNLINTSSASGWIDLKNQLSYEWNDDDASNGNNRVKNSAISEIFAAENDHRLALLNCNFTIPHPEYCFLIIQTHNFDNTAQPKKCIVNPPKAATSIEKVQFLQGNTLLIGWLVRDEPESSTARRTHYQLTTTDTCRREGYAVIKESLDKFTKGHSIFVYDDHFDIAFRDRGACRDDLGYYCRQSYANSVENFMFGIPKLQETRLRTEPGSFILNDLYPMRGAVRKDAAFVVGYVNTSRWAQVTREYVYSPVTNGWAEIRGPLSHVRLYSNSSGHATLCWSPSSTLKELKCMWLDGTRPLNDTMELTFSISRETVPYFHNKPDGSIVMVRAAADRNYRNGKVVVDQGHMGGWCERLAEFEVRDVEIDKFELTLIENDVYCVSYLGKKHTNDKSKLPVRKTFVTRCVKGRVINDHFDCGNEKYYV